jgi:hypothetical protein
MMQLVPMAKIVPPRQGFVKRPILRAILHSRGSLDVPFRSERTFFELREAEVR